MASLPQIRAVIFDYGLVLSQPQDPASHQHLMKLTGLDYGDFEKLYWQFRPAHDRGDLDGRAFWTAVLEQSRRRPTEDLLSELTDWDNRMWSLTVPEMMEWAEQLRRAGLVIGILSNMSADLAAHLRRTADWVTSFDIALFSGELRTIKPEAAIYRILLEALEKRGISPAESLFLDDREENVEAARAVGIHGMAFRNLQLLKEDLRNQSFALPPLALP